VTELKRIEGPHGQLAEALHALKVMTKEVNAARDELATLRALLRRWTNAAGKAEQEQGFTTTDLHHCWVDTMAKLP
jgi:hypothetical protein